MVYFSRKIFYKTLLFLILKRSKESSNIVIWKKIIALTILATENFTFEIGNSRVVIVHCATREKKIYFASVKFDARAKRG